MTTTTLDLRKDLTVEQVEEVMMRIQEGVEDAFIDRAKGLGLEPGTKAFSSLERNFFAGAYVAIDSIFPPKLKGQISDLVPSIWTTCTRTGTPIIVQYPEET